MLKNCCAFKIDLETVNPAGAIFSSYLFVKTNFVSERKIFAAVKGVKITKFVLSFVLDLM